MKNVTVLTNQNCSAWFGPSNILNITFLQKNFTVLTDHRALLSVLKSHRSNKPYNCRLTRWIDRLLPFDFNIKHISCTRMGLVDYISLQPNQKAKSITQYDEEFMVATISRILDAIITLFSHSNKISFQRQHHTSNCQLQVNKTRVHSCKVAKRSAHTPNASNNSLTTIAKVNNYNPKFISSFNCHTNHLLKINTAPSPRIQSQNLTLNSATNPNTNINHIVMSANESAQNNPSTSPQTPRVTFRTQSTSNTSTNASINITQASSSPEHRDIELPREEIFENNLNQLFTKSFLAVLTSKGAVLK